MSHSVSLRISFFKPVFLAFLAALCAFTGTVAHAAPATPWAFDFSGAKGVSLSYQGIPIIRRSTLYVVKPGWTGLHYDQRSQKHEVQKQDDGSWHITGNDAQFHAEYHLRPLDAHTFELNFRGELLEDVPAEIEFNAGFFNANLLMNRPFQAQTRATATSPARILNGVVPAYPPRDGLAENDLAPGFQTIEFDSRLGKMSLQVQSSSRIIFASAQRHKPLWAQETPIFWCGWMAGMQPLRRGQPVEVTLKIHLAPPTPAIGKTASFRPVATPVADAFSTAGRPVQIVPQPKHIFLDAQNRFALRETTPWSVTAPRGETRLTAAVERLLNEEWNLKLPAAHTIASPSNSWCGIRLGSDKPILFPARPDAAEWIARPDSYRLTVNQDGIQIIAPTARGAFYGVQTLAQMLRSNSKNVFAPFAEIEDWATLEFRGAHWFPSQSGVPFHKKLIGIMARNKLNHAVIQCEAARWDSHPEIAAPNSISKKDLRELVEWCRANFIEPIPLINGPGHATWMFRNNQNLDLAEDPKTPYAYAVNNPKSLAFIREIFSEAIEVFQPKIFHIGHDEVTLRGRFPNPDSPFYRKDQSVTDLVLANLQAQEKWLAQRGIQTMIWGDMFLSPQEGVDAAFAPSIEEAQKRRALIPKGVIVADWHYGNNEKYPSLKLFEDAGIKTIASTWNRPLNIRHFTRAAIEAKSQGMLQTTWAGFFPDANTLRTELSQFSAFIQAADYSWTGRSELPDDLPYDVSTRWKRDYASQNKAERPGILFNLEPAAQVAPEDWLQLGEGWDLAKLYTPQSKTAARHFEDIAFNIPARGLTVLSTAPSAMAPTGALQELKMEVNRSASEIAFLHSTLWSVPEGTTAARCLVEYTDGSHSEIKFTTGENIASWQGNTIVSGAVRAWSEQSPANTQFSLRSLRWENPHPEKTIARLQFKPVDSEAGYVLAGLTLIH